MDELDLTNVRVFREIARTLSFSQAAELLELSQPAISMRLRSLEQQLGVELFERGPAGTKLTSAGDAFLPIAEELLRLSAQARERVQPSLDNLTGRLTIGCASSAGKYLLPELVAAYLRQFPKVDVQIPVVSRVDLERGLHRGDFDIGVTSRRLKDGEMAYSNFFLDHLKLIVPSSHPWGHRSQVKPEELIGQRFICREPDSACRDIVSAGLEPFGLDMTDLSIVMEVGSAEALAMAVERGIGIAFVSMIAALPRMNLGRLSMLEVQGVKLTNQVEWVQTPSRPTSLELTAFLEVANQASHRRLAQNLAEGKLL